MPFVEMVSRTKEECAAFFPITTSPTPMSLFIVLDMRSGSRQGERNKLRKAIGAGVVKGR
jgi:hypothetical protein